MSASLASYLFNVFAQGGAPGSFLATFASFASVSDMQLALVQSDHLRRHRVDRLVPKGLSTQGGPIGVANSVNAAVVESILVLMIVNVGISQLYIMLVPRVGLV